MRFPYSGYWFDKQGAVVQSGTITVYLAGGTTAATVYESETGSALTNSQTTTDTNGRFEFWVDTDDYNMFQRFRVIGSKSGNIFADLDIDDIIVYVGPGTSDQAPTNSNTVTPIIIVLGNGVKGALQVIRHTSVGGAGGILMASATRGNDADSHTVLEDGDGVGAFMCQGSDGVRYITGADITAVINGTPGTSNLPCDLVFKVNAGGAITSERMRITKNGNFGINTNLFDGTVAGAIAIKNGTAPGAGTADQSYLYARDVSSSSEVHVMDEAGNESQLSPHNGDVLIGSDPLEPFPFTYTSKNVYLGKEIAIDMTKVIREVERLSGKNFIKVSDMPIEDKVDWTENQDAIVAAREKEIESLHRRKKELDCLIEEEKDGKKRDKLIREKECIIIPDPYIRKEPPQWLKNRGISLR